jgi:hypothetical protein
MQKTRLFLKIFCSAGLKRATVRPPIFPANHFLFFGRFLVILQNFQPAGNSDDISSVSNAGALCSVRVRARKRHLHTRPCQPIVRALAKYDIGSRHERS